MKKTANKQKHRFEQRGTKDEPTMKKPKKLNS
jgi:hypothetical protein